MQRSRSTVPFRPLPSSRPPAGPSNPLPAHVRITRLDVLRKACEVAIEAWRTSGAGQAPRKLLAVRAIQEHIAKTKHRNPAAAQRDVPEAWVDDWSPPQA